MNWHRQFIPSGGFREGRFSLSRMGRTLTERDPAKPEDEWLDEFGGALNKH
jgi:hypothetical protein